MAKKDIFYFTAQTGVWKLKKPKAPSNFYVYTLPWSALGKVQSAVRDAKVGSGGLEYHADFLHWLEHNDLEGGSNA